MKTKNVRTTWAALLTAALLSAPAVAWGQTQGVRVASTDVTKVNTTENPTSGQLVDANNSSTVKVTVTDKTAENKVAKVTVTKVTDVKMTSFAISGSGSVTFGSTTTYSITNIVPTYADLTDVTWTVTNGTGTATINASGVLTPTKAGSVTVTATSTANNTVKASKAVTINKAAGDATLSPSSVDFGTTTGSKTVTVSGNTGTVSSASVTSGSGCTASVSGNTITITRNSNEAFDATVTVTIDASTNYNSTTKTITVTGSAVYQAGDAELVTMGSQQFIKLYTSATNGYYIALNDKYTGYPVNTGVNWNTACDASESFGGKTFTCGSSDDWEKIISACGGADTEGFSCINDKFRNVVTGWVDMTNYYWTSSKEGNYFLCFSWDDHFIQTTQSTSEYGVRLIASF